MQHALLLVHTGDPAIEVITSDHAAACCVVRAQHARKHCARESLQASVSGSRCRQLRRILQFHEG